MAYIYIKHFFFFSFLRYNDIIIIMYIYHALINALSALMIHIKINIILYTHVEHIPNKTIYINYYKKQNKTKTHYTHTHTHSLTHSLTVAETGY